MVLGQDMKDIFNVFFIFLRLGLTSFGGPVAHLAYFRSEFVQHRKWFTEEGYANLVALCQFLPGPASSQVGMIIGFSRAGYGGLFAAWIGFTLPSTLLLIAFALGLNYFGQTVGHGVLYGLKIVAVVVVIQAIWVMGKNLCPDRNRITIMAIAASALLLLPSVATQILILLIAGATGALLFKKDTQTAIASKNDLAIRVSKPLALINVFLFISLLFLLPLWANNSSNDLVDLIDIFYRAGSLVFGGGHVVLPLLQADFVPSLLDSDRFLAGYGAVQAVPGPLFTFSAFLGSSINSADTLNAINLGLFSTVLIFIPSFLMVIGVLPFWQMMQHSVKMKAALTGINAAVVGILLAALFDPIWVNSIQNTKDFVFALLVMILLLFWRLPIWLIVIGGGMAGGLLDIMNII